MKVGTGRQCCCTTGGKRATVPLIDRRSVLNFSCDAACVTTSSAEGSNEQKQKRGVMQLISPVSTN